jgi:phosphatidylglycerophosphate synthase
MKANFGLHRVGKKSDWDKTSHERWNIWQRLAGSTGGTFTIGNIFTFVGLGLVILGLIMIMSEMYGWGFVCIAAGRLCDLADGWLANYTKTKSPLGESLDSGADKVGTASTLIVLGLLGIVPWLIVLGIFVTQLALACFALLRWLQGKRLHPSRLGKYSMATAWFGLGAFVLSMVASGTTYDWLQAVAYILCGASGLMALVALVRYIRR